MNVAQQCMSQKKMKINVQTGLLDQALFKPTDHCDERPEQVDIDTIIIHNISLPPGEFGGSAIEEFFCGELDRQAHPYFAEIAHLRVAPHILIKRNGDIIQFVPFHLRAWHAGESNFQGRARCNDFSIGIELEGSDIQPFEDIQYIQLSAMTNALLSMYHLSRDRIVGHADVAPGRKTDPGPMFDWDYFKGNLK